MCRGHGVAAREDRRDKYEANPMKLVHRFVALSAAAIVLLLLLGSLATA
jgi:hypothetical protein